jgi:microcystin-dependent protein
VIGTNYGAGDGSLTFNVPDLRGRTPVGIGTNASVSSLNANDGQAVGNRRPHHRTSNSLGINASGSLTNGPISHNNGSANGACVIDDSQFNSGSTLGVSVSASLTGSIGTNNSNDAVDTPSFVVVNYIIKT